MSLACLTCRSALAGIAAGHASDSQRLEVEAHLQECESCRGEQARWAVIAELKEAPTQQLAQPARERVRRAMMRAAEASLLERTAERRPAWSWSLALGTVAIVALAAGIAARQLRHRGAEVVSGEVAVGGLIAAPGTAILDGQQLASASGGVVRLDGPVLALGPGARISWDRPRHTVSLETGAVTVDVEPGRGLEFRVVTERFAAEVIGTRFVASGGMVYTERGKVRIVGSDGRQLATLTAGQRWSPPLPEAAPGPAAVPAPAPAPLMTSAAAPGSPGAAPPATEAPPARIATPEPLPPAAGDATAPAPDEPARHVSRAANGRTNPATAPLGGPLAAARSAIARGQTTEARALLAPLFEHRRPPAIDAEATMLLAEAALVDGRRDEQLRRLRGVIGSHPSLPQAESALFAIVQFESEAGHPAEARRAIADYLGRYPRGRFLVEVRGRLARLEQQR